MTFGSFKRGGDAGYRTENGADARRRGSPKSSTPRWRSSPRKALRQPNAMTSQAEQGSQKRSSTSTLKPRKRFSAPLPGPRSRYSLKRSKARLWLPMGHLPQLAPRLLSRAAGTMKSSRLLAIARMVIGESRNFPDLARMWHDDVVASVIGIVTGVIARAQARGEVAPGDPRL